VKTVKLNICPFRTYTETKPAIMRGQGDITVTGFMECLEHKCPAFYTKDEYIPGTGVGQVVEYCKRLD